MKAAAILSFSVLICILGCQPIQNKHSFIKFDIHGHINGVENQKIALLIDGQSTDERLITEVINDEFFFSGNIGEVLKADIVLEDDFSDDDQMYQSIGVFLEEDVEVRFEGEGLGMPFFESGVINKDAFDRFICYSDYFDAADSIYERSIIARQIGDHNNADSLMNEYKNAVELANASYFEEMILPTAYPVISLQYLNARCDNYSFSREESAEYLLMINNADTNSLYYKNLQAYSHSELLIGIGKPYRDMRLYNSSLESSSLSEFITGQKLVLLDFWASYCKPCLEAHEEYLKIYQNYHNKGLQIIGISADRSTNDWLNRISVDDLPWPQLLIPQNSGCKILYGIERFPSNFILDDKGTIIFRDINVGSLDSLLQKYTW